MSVCVLICSPYELLPFWVLLGKLDSTEESWFHMQKRAECGCWCLTQLRALRLCISPTLLRDSSLLETSHQSVDVNLEAVCLPCFAA